VVHELTSGGSPQTLATLAFAAQLYGLAADATNLYWCDDGTPAALYGDGAVRTMARTGGTVTPVVTGLTHPRDTVVDPERVYYADGFSSFEVASVSAGDAGAKLVYGNQHGPHSLQLVGTDLFWVTSDASPLVLKAPAAGGAATTVVTSTSAIGRSVVDGSTLYFTDAASGTVGKLALSAGSTPVVLASGLKSPGDLVVDATYVYWIDTDDFDRTLRRIAR
jgi:hypothetical protein